MHIGSKIFSLKQTENFSLLFHYQISHMQIIDKPQSTKLPFSLSRKMILHNNMSNLPQIDIGIMNHRKILSKFLVNKVTYHLQIDRNICRPIIRTALSKNLTFEIIKDREKFAPEILIESFREPVKTLAFKQPRLQAILTCIKDIFGEDFLLKDRELIAVEGKITKKCFMFFVSSHYCPFSLCHGVPIFLKISDSADMDFLNETLDHSPEKEPMEIIENNGLRTEFICSQCKKTVLKLVGNSRKKEANFPLKKRVKSKERREVDIERKKISLSVMIASGRFRKHRLNQGKSPENRRYIDNSNYGQSIDLLSQRSKQYLNPMIASRKKTQDNYQLH